MQTISLLGPVLAQILLTIAVYILLGRRKSAAVKAGQVNRELAALDNSAWPQSVVKVSNNLANQFEAPVLFYTLCLVLMALEQGNGMAVPLAWLFVLSRCAHAWVHIGSNHVPYRFRLFAFGLLLLLAMTLLALWQWVQMTVN
ncbi:MAG: MAPEG family protein [Halieaceae bacterium]|uniref:MAPEG family protein n=1 Tax=Haliea alexandrii TaxID=2448162 RepID=UPI000F0B3980|nr:MAPEG family protein [Haliea alexandrii]MCR9184321.1 MAPEG family protein [Halieaceae bacterium]